MPMAHPCTINLQVTGAQANTDTVKSAAEGATFYETLVPGSPATEDAAIALWGTPFDVGGLTVTENAADPDAVVINIDYTADYSPAIQVLTAIEALDCEVYCTYYNPTLGYAGIYSFGQDRAYHTFDEAFFLLPDGIVLADLYSIS
jgi:hypothetical protein